MREYGLSFSAEGQIIGRDPPTPRPTTFPLEIASGTLTVKYTRDYYPRQDSMYFTKDQPSQPHCLSETGYWHQFALHDAVEAVGGPQGGKRGREPAPDPFFLLTGSLSPMT